MLLALRNRESTSENCILELVQIANAREEDEGIEVSTVELRMTVMLTRENR